jgi:hypothetical protein
MFTYDRFMKSGNEKVMNRTHALIPKKLKNVINYHNASDLFSAIKINTIKFGCNSMKC